MAAVTVLGPGLPGVGCGADVESAARQVLEWTRNFRDLRSPARPEAVLSWNRLLDVRPLLAMGGVPDVPGLFLSGSPTGDEACVQTTTGEGATRVFDGCRLGPLSISGTVSNSATQIGTRYQASLTLTIATEEMTGTIGISSSLTLGNLGPLDKCWRWTGGAHVTLNLTASGRTWALTVSPDVSTSACSGGESSATVSVRVSGYFSGERVSGTSTVRFGP